MGAVRAVGCMLLLQVLPSDDNADAAAAAPAVSAMTVCWHSAVSAVT